MELAASGSKKNLRVITASIVALRTLSKTGSCTVWIVGGEVNVAYEDLGTTVLFAASGAKSGELR